MLDTLLLAPGFQTSVIALATHGYLQFKNIVSMKTGESFENRGRMWEKMAAGWKYTLAVINFVMAIQACLIYISFFKALGLVRKFWKYGLCMDIFLEIAWLSRSNNLEK